jgi:nucleoside-diphosphate-sugar epimerase
MARLIILGATGFVGRSLAHSVASTRRHELVLAGRRRDRLEEISRQSAQAGSAVSVIDLERFPETEADAVLNCLGAGDPVAIRELGLELMQLTERWDDTIIRWLSDRPSRHYIAFSSGVVHGVERPDPVGENSLATFPVNALDRSHHYAVSKLNSETKHRMCSSLNIVDLRVFGFVSRFLDPSDHYFLSDVAAALVNGRPLTTFEHDIVRDYIHPDDLTQLIEKCLDCASINDAFDVFSREAVRKFDLLNALRNRFGLHWQTNAPAAARKDVAPKFAYFSADHRARSIGYRPAYSARDAVLEEMERFLDAIYPIRRASGDDRGT